MGTKYKAAIERGNPPQGTIKSVVSFKDNGGGRWEYVGAVPLAAAQTMMALCATNGKSASLYKGADEGISQAFAKGGAA